MHPDFGGDAAPQEATSSCCPPPQKPRELPGYQLWPFVCGWIETTVGATPQVSTRLKRIDILGRWQMRWGMGRDRYRIAPGLYAVGTPDADAPVLVTANYKLTFDTLRGALIKQNLWILVLETYGINVWCAAGKGSFGTDELLRRIEATQLTKVVNHRRLILPQLGAVGVAAHTVQKQSGFRCLYGPIRAEDLPDFLANEQKATPAMRRVTFSAMERLVLTPVELTALGRKTLWIALGLLIAGGFGPGVFSFAAAFSRGGAAIAVALLGLLCGAVLTPLFLPWLPGRAFALKGAALGAAVALPFAFGAASFSAGLALLLSVTAISSWCGMSFTGSTPFTSPSGVEKEMRQAIPLQGGAAIVAAILWFISAFA